MITAANLGGIVVARSRIHILNYGKTGTDSAGLIAELDRYTRAEIGSVCNLVLDIGNTPIAPANIIPGDGQI